ncbi:MAG: DUF4349 domain-containing protein [Phormidesmis sp.]
MPIMKRLWFAFFTSSVVVAFGLTSCAQSPSSSSDSMAMDSAAEVTSPAPTASAQKMANSSNASDRVSGEPPADNIATSNPQLIKRASLSLSVDSVEESFEQVRQVVKNQQGDLLSLREQGENQRRLTAEMRVPQQKLDTALDAIAQIGTVRDRTISSEDVSGQLVDIQARLSNARKSESALQEIMSRSGDIADVLEVSRELSSVRQSIEQMAAQQKSLQTQVSYSTISLSLESAIATSPTQPAFTRQLSNSWEGATNSVGEFTTDLLQLGLWLLAYSPYLAILLGGALIARRVRRSLP